MKKIISVCYLFLLTFFIFLADSFALSSSEISTIYHCDTEKFEVAIATSANKLEKVSCHTTYDEAKTAMENYESTVSNVAVILERVSGKTTLINAKYAIANLHRGSYTTNIYTSNALSSAYTYINANKSGGGVDAAFIDINYSNKAANIELSDYRGWVKTAQYEIVPISWVKSTNYYVVSSDTIKHCYTYNMLNTSSNPTCNTIGPKPSMLNEATYYSYDGKYMYTSLKDMLEDYKKNTNKNAVNSSNPYYNYYMYLPHRTRTNYSSVDIDDYIRSLGYKEKIYSGSASSGQSMLYGEGTFFYNAQEKYGANAIMMFAVARNESGNGRSAISIDKNNLFGHNAVDSNPYYGANGYLTVSLGIYRHAWGYVSYGYNEPLDSRFFGANLGTKATGFNVKYASDPYWGEKASAHYYSFDKAKGLEDYNFYQLAVKNDNSTIYAYHTSSTSSVKSYPLKRKDEPIVIVEETTGTTINGSNKWYKIISDQTLDEKGNKILYDANRMQEYTWDNGYAYVHSSYFTKINNVELKDPNKDIFEYGDKNYTINTYYNASAKTLTPKVGLVKNIASVYYDVTLTKKKESLAKEGYVTVLEEAVSKDGEIKAYLVSYDASKNTREWISVNDLTITNNTYGMIKSNTSAYSNTSKSTNYGTIYKNTYVAVLEEKTVSSTKWLKVSFKANSNQVAWVLASDVTYDSSLVFVEEPGEAVVSFERIKHVDNSNFEIAGSLYIEKMNITSARDVKYYLILKNELDENDIYSFSLARWKDDYPYEITDSKYDYSGAWFKDVINLKDVSNGNYVLYVKIVVDGIKEKEVLFRNIALKEMTKRVTDKENKKAFEFRTDYYSKDAKLNLFVRENLITDYVTSSYQNMFNTYFTIDFNDNNLNIVGNAFNILGDYGKDKIVTRKVILENISTFERYEFDTIKDVVDIPYDITLTSGNKDLTNAWYTSSIDLSSLKDGTYSINILTNSSVSDYSEIYDIAFRDVDFTQTINNKTYKITRNDNLRYRLELSVKTN